MVDLNGTIEVFSRQGTKRERWTNHSRLMLGTSAESVHQGKHVLTMMATCSS